jgi:hypothetical protein
MPQILLLFALLTCATCDILTKISSSSISQPDNVLFASSNVWYKTTSNTLINLLNATTNIPPTLLPYTIELLETTNNRIVLFGEFANTTAPIYWTDGVKFMETVDISKHTGYTIHSTHHLSVDNNDYLMITLWDKFATLRYTPVCICLQTKIMYELPFLSPLQSHTFASTTAKKFYISMNNINTTIIEFDPVTKDSVILDEFTKIDGSMFSLNNSIIYQNGPNVTQYNVITRQRTTMIIEEMIFSILETPSLENPNMFVMSTTGNTLFCKGIITACTSASFYTEAITNLPLDNGIAYIPKDSNKLLYYASETREALILYGNLKMDKIYDESKVVYEFLSYHEHSDCIIFVGAEKKGVETVSVNLFKFNMKTEMVDLVTSLCYDQDCTFTKPPYHFNNDGTITIIKTENSLFLLYELEIEEPQVPTQPPIDNPGNIAAIVLGVLVGLVVLAFIVFMTVVAINRYKNAIPNTPQQYELVDEL